VQSVFVKKVSAKASFLVRQRRCSSTYHGCGAGVVKSRRFLAGVGVGLLTTLGVSRIF